MNNTLFEELKFKVLKSGNPIFLYIGINTLIFLVVSLIHVIVFLMQVPFSIDAIVREYFAFPASFDALPLRFYTIITYQFFHEGFLHLLFNMLWLYWMGKIFLDFLKPRQFHFVYLAGGIAGALFYTLAFHVFPVFATSISGATIIGSSASVMAIVVAAATLVPDYSIRLLLLGDVKLKYLALAYIVLDVIGIATTNAGGSFAHLGGALLGFVFIKSLRSGNDWSNLFKRKSKLKVVRNESFTKNNAPKGNVVAQHEIDAILDKISKTGYDKLSKEEKDTLFKASKH